MKKYIITPQFQTVHDVYYSKIAEEKNLHEFPRFRGKTYLHNFSKLEIIITIIRWFRILPKIINLIIIKKDIRNLTFDKVNIGQPVNDWCIARSKNARANIFPILRYTLKAMLFYTVLKSEFDKGNISFVLGTSEPYPFNSISCQLAKMYKIPVKELRGIYDLLTFDYNEETLSSDWKKSFSKENYKKITSKNLNFSKDCLEKQVKAEREHIVYISKFNKANISIDLNGYVVIYCHDFFDAPNFYGTNVFPNHCVWIEYTIKYLSRRGINVAVKVHPNEINSSSNVVNKIEKKFPNTLFIKDDISLLELKKFNIRGIITVFGSIQFEASFIQIPVISACNMKYMNVCNYSESLSEYNKHLNKLIYKEKLYIPDKEFVIKTYYLFWKYILTLEVQNKSFLPYDDIPKKIWDEVFTENYPLNFRHRLKLFKHSQDYKKYLENKLDKINLTKLLKI